MLRRLRWYFAKKRLASSGPRYPPAHVKSFMEGHGARLQNFLPNTEAFETLASVWDDYAGWNDPGYAGFLITAGNYYGEPIRSVLDLGCGTGLLSRQAAAWAELVVGLDVSSAMLREARGRTPRANVRYVQGDFRDFRLDQAFDAAVCGGDSLNYIDGPEELSGVFTCVARHLRPGGLFAFDVLDDQAFRGLAGLRMAAQVGAECFEFYFFYDPGRRVSESRTVFGDAVERHKRIPIEKKEVVMAAGAAGFHVAESFSEDLGLGLSQPAKRRFYLLRKI